MNSQQASIGVIGLGLLGSAIATRLLDVKWTVVGFDLAAERRDVFQSNGGGAVTSVGEVLVRCDIVFISLPTSEIVADLVSANIDEFRTGQVIIDTTTGAPQQMIDIGNQLASVGATYIESTVGGSSQQLEQGDAALFIGGPTEIVQSEDVDALLSALSSKIFHLGNVGSASRFKLVHNLILGLNRAVLAEGLCFAEALGLDPAKTLEILQQTAAASSVMQTKGEKMVGNDFAPQARLSQHLKDVRLMEDEARHEDVQLPLTHLHRSMLEFAEQLGHGDSDNSAIIEAIRIWSEK